MKNSKNSVPEEITRPSPGRSEPIDLDAMLEDLKAGRIGINLDDSEDNTAGRDTDSPNRFAADEPDRDSADEPLGTADDVPGEHGADGEDNTPDDSEGNSRKKEPINWKNEIISWIQVLITAAIIAFCIDTFIIANSKVPTGSMETTIMPGDRVIGSRLHYRFGDPQRGDIVIFVYPDDEANGIETFYVKRLIGMPGDSIDIVDGKVYLNGSDTPLDEPYIREPMMWEPPMHFEVPEDSYFMLGDNRNNSNDSRRWTHKYVKRDKMIAKVLFQYFPKIRKIQ